MGPLKGESDHRHSLLSRPQSPITVFVHPDTKHSLLEAGKTTIMLLFIIAKALILKHVLSEEQIPQAIAGSISAARTKVRATPSENRRAALPCRSSRNRRRCAVGETCPSSPVGSAAHYRRQGVRAAHNQFRRMG